MLFMCKWIFVCAVVHSLLKSAFNTVAIEKEKIKQVLSEQELSSQSAQIMTLRHSLSQVSTVFLTLCLSFIIIMLW